MANQKIIEQKKQVVEEIANKMKESASYIFFEYRGLTVPETNELRKKLRESESEFKIYKNTLSKRALESKVGVIDGEITDIETLNKLATIPSREGLLTMLAGGLMGVVKDLSICLDLYSQDLENK